ncbi:MAG: transcriptional repressor LexA [Thermodesulfobacteriota bacterium]
MAPELTPKQARLLQFLEQEILRAGVAPSLRRTAAALGVSHAAVSQLIKALEQKGVVDRGGRYGRNLFLLRPSPKTEEALRGKPVPIVGTIAAGLPLYAQQEWAGTVWVDAALYRSPHLFALRVQGDSMTNAAILDRDIVICEPRQFAENGEIVAALIRQEEATVKRFFRQGSVIELRPENPRFSSVQYGLGEVLVQGKVIGVIRNLE